MNRNFGQTLAWHNDAGGIVQPETAQLTFLAGISNATKTLHSLAST